VVALVKEWLRDIPGVKDIQDDQAAGRPTMELRWRPEALADANLDVVTATRTAALLADGEYVGETRRGGETWRVIVQAKPVAWPSVPSWLDLPIVTPAGGAVPLSVLADVTVRETAGVVRRYQYTRSVTVEAELDRTVAETQAVNAELLRRWQAVAAQYPNVTLDFTGELDDIKESLAALQKIFLVGVGLIYLILATQFRSYVQPLVILVTVPLAFTGVVFGLAASGLPLSLYTMYGVVALTGIAVNSAIVLVAAVNDRRSAGMSPIHAVVTAARRRIDHVGHDDRWALFSGNGSGRSLAPLGAGGVEYRLGAGRFDDPHPFRGAAPVARAVAGSSETGCNGLNGGQWFSDSKVVTILRK